MATRSRRNRRRRPSRPFGVCETQKIAAAVATLLDGMGSSKDGIFPMKEIRAVTNDAVFLRGREGDCEVDGRDLPRVSVRSWCWKQQVIPLAGQVRA